MRYYKNIRFGITVKIYDNFRISTKDWRDPPTVLLAKQNWVHVLFKSTQYSYTNKYHSSTNNLNEIYILFRLKI